MKLFTRPPPSLTIRQARVSHKLSLQLCRDTQVLRSPMQPRRSLLNLKSFSFWGEFLRGASIWFTSCGRTPDQKREREKKTEREREKRKKSVVKSSKQNSPALHHCRDRPCSCFKETFFCRTKVRATVHSWYGYNCFSPFFTFLFSFSFVFSRRSPTILLIPDSGNSETPGVHVLEKWSVVPSFRGK